MEKEFTEYTEALALKELGFDEPCLDYFANSNPQNSWTISYNSDDLHKPFESVARPTYSQAFRFFREKYNIEVAVACFYSNRLDIPYEERQYHCHVIRDGVTSKGPKYKTYEEAELACLSKLIEIVEQKEK